MLNTKMIGNRIAEARKKKNISQAQLAEHLFISPQAVGKWERGESMPDIVTFNRLAEILDVDLNYFSENFSPIEQTSIEAMDIQLTESPSLEQKKKLNWDMSGGNWVDADFSGMKNLHEKLNFSNMKQCKFIGSDMSRLFLRGNNIDSCDFTRSDIGNSHIQGSYLINTIFKDCLLKESKFSESHITDCDFSGADFSEVEFKSAAFEKSKFTNALWSSTSFIGTHIADTVLEGKLEDCYFENCGFKRVKFQNAMLVNTFFKNNRKLKQVEFIDCQADRISYEFLKNGKADLTGITLLNE
jgi:uncharacterized protein YjbI with pentapeptide repeats